MPRVLKGAARRRKHSKIIKGVRGHRGAEGRHYRVARQAVTRAGEYAYRDRKARKREFRSLWITRISAACRQRGIRYSQFISGLRTAGITLNRKMLSEIAVADPAMFDKIAQSAGVAG
ncbi:MAG: 50S ribosomal protein L20 [Planctomycetota bacterium]